MAADANEPYSTPWAFWIVLVLVLLLIVIIILTFLALRDPAFQTLSPSSCYAPVSETAQLHNNSDVGIHSIDTQQFAGPAPQSVGLASNSIEAGETYKTTTTTTNQHAPFLTKIQFGPETYVQGSNFQAGSMLVCHTDTGCCEYIAAQLISSSLLVFNNIENSDAIIGAQLINPDSQSSYMSFVRDEKTPYLTLGPIRNSYRTVEKPVNIGVVRYDGMMPSAVQSESITLKITNTETLEEIRLTKVMNQTATIVFQNALDPKRLGAGSFRISASMSSAKSMSGEKPTFYTKSAQSYPIKIHR